MIYKGEENRAVTAPFFCETPGNMGKTVWSKLRSIFTEKGRYQKDRSTRPNINEEYRETLRSKSYVEISSKVQRRLQRKSFHHQSPSSSSSSPIALLSPHLPEPRLESIKGSNLHPLLLDYLQVILKATNLSELLLQSIKQTHADYDTIRRVIRLANTDREQLAALYQDLTQFAMHKNPLSIIAWEEFHDARDEQTLLLHRLTMKCRKTWRKLKLVKFCNTVAVGALAVAYVALAVATLVLMIHTTLGVLAMPGIFACNLRWYKRYRKIAKRSPKRNSLVKLGSKLECVARGVYILINDFDTTSRILKRLHDEIEHCKVVVAMSVRIGKTEALKMVLRDLENHETNFTEQLQELEEHVCFCLVTISKSKRLVLKEMVDK